MTNHNMAVEGKAQQDVSLLEKLCTNKWGRINYIQLEYERAYIKTLPPSEVLTYLQDRLKEYFIEHI